MTGKIKASTTLKDVNFMRERQGDNKFVEFSKVDRARLLRALQRDVEFLRRNGIMDYSLLLGIE